MGAFDFLMGAQVPQLPDPMVQAQRGMSLAALATQLQTNQLALQQRQQAMTAMPQLLQRISAGEDPMAVAASLGPQAPLAIGDILKQVQDYQKNAAETQKFKAQGTEANQKAFQAASGQLANMAAGALNAINAGQPLTPMQKQMIGAQAAHAAQIGGYDPAQIAAPSVMAPDSDWQQFLGMASAAGTSPKDAFDMLIAKTKLGPELALTQAKTGEANATTAKTQLETQQLPADLAVKQQTANAATTRAGAAAANARTNAGRLSLEQVVHLSPQVQVSEATGQPLAVNRFAPGGPTVAPIENAPQMKPTPVQSALAKDTAANVGKMQDAKTAAQQGQLLLSQMQAMDAKGIYSGGIQGTNAFKDLANIAAAAHLPGVDVDKLANTQAWDAESGNLVAQMVKQLGGNRITNNELNFMRNIKPNTLQSQAGRQMLYGILQKAFQNQIDQADQAGSYVQQPGVYSLSGFTPKMGGTGTLTRNPDGSYTYTK